MGEERRGALCARDVGYCAMANSWKCHIVSVGDDDDDDDDDDADSG